MRIAGYNMARKILGAGIFIFTAARPVAAAPQCQHDATTFRCVKYLENYDGDTITVMIPEIHPLFGDRITVRVNGLDTPEMKTHDPCEKKQADLAKERVRGLLVQAKTIELRRVARDKYFRVLADVVADGVNISDVLLKENLAYPYAGGTKEKRNWCAVPAVTRPSGG